MSKPSSEDGGVEGGNEGGGLRPSASGSRWQWLRRRGRGLSALVVGMGLGMVLFAKFQTCKEPQPGCKEAWKRGDDTLAVLICEKEYARTKDPRIGAILANAMRDDQPLAARQVATELLETPARADALFVLGKIEENLEEAIRLFTQAAELHTQGGQWREASIDLLALAKVHKERQEFVAALGVLDRGVHLATKAGAPELAESFHQGAVHVLREMGNVASAWKELELASARDPDSLNALWAAADLRQDVGAHHAAAAQLERALAKEPSPSVALKLHLNLAFSLVEIDRLDEAATHLEIARNLDTKNRMRASRSLIEGLLAWKRGDLVGADRHLAESVEASEPDEQNDKAEHTMHRAEVALKRGDLPAAADHARRALSWLDEVRAKQQVPHYRSWITDRYRHVHELLFLALARAGRAEEALLALDRWQREGAIDGLTPSAPEPGAAGLQSAAKSARELARIRTELSTVALAEQRDLEELRHQLAGEDFVALVIVRELRGDPGELWRLASHHGALSLASIGSLGPTSELRRLIDRVSTDAMAPAHRRDAEQLADLLVPAAQRVASAAPLHLLLDSELTTLPVEALRIEGAPLIALRPVVRVLRPAIGACAPPLPASPRVAILADARGDLPGARSEGRHLAARFGVAARFGAQATAEALDEPVDLLHLAVHAQDEPPSPTLGLITGEAATAQGGVLRMADDLVYAADIATRDRSPKLVVLASCLSAIAKSGNHSLTTAYLASGADQVIATLRPIDDAGATEVVAELYRQGAERDPVHGLARAQASLARRAATTRGALARAGLSSLAVKEHWPSFAVYGKQTCRAASE